MRHSESGSLNHSSGWISQEAEKIGGVGLGLAMVREIVQVHDGEIEVHGNEQGGTTFEVKMSIERLTIKVKSKMKVF